MGSDCYKTISRLSTHTLLREHANAKVLNVCQRYHFECFPDNPNANIFGS